MNKHKESPLIFSVLLLCCILLCINAWNKSLEKASDTIKKDIEIKEQEVIEKIHQESIPTFGLG